MPIVKLLKDSVIEPLLVMAWRSNPLVYQGLLKQTAPLQWENHIDWWRKDRAWEHWLIVYGEGIYERPVGQVNVVNLDTDCPEIGYFIGEIPLWGKGIATDAVSDVIDWCKEHGYKKICADVRQDNPASVKLLKKLGFREVEGQDGLQGYLLEI